MNCNQCPYNNNGGNNAEDMLTHPFGNPFTITFPMTSVVVMVNNGNEVQEDRNFPIYDVVVALLRGKRRYEYVPRISTNAITFNDRGVLPVGTYDIEITYRGTDSMHYRYKQEDFIRILDSAKAGGTYTSDGCDIIAYYPKIKGNISAIDITDNEVTINEGRGFTGDNTPNDGYADMSAEYGTSSIEVGENDVTITI